MSALQSLVKNEYSKPSGSSTRARRVRCVTRTLTNRPRRADYLCQTSFNVYAQDVALRDDTGSLSLKGLDRLREHFAALQRVCTS